MPQSPGIETKRADRAARRAAARAADQRRRLRRGLGIALLVAVAAAGGLIFASRFGGADDLVVADSLPASVPREGRIMGDPTAPVTLVEWGDYQ